MNVYSNKASRNSHLGGEPGPAIAAIKSCLQARRPVISMANWLSTPDSAKVGVIIDALLRKSTGAKGSWLTLFGNSTTEMMNVLIRLSRQRASESGLPSRKVAIYDPAEKYTTLFQPICMPGAVHLTPEVFAFKDGAAFSDSLATSEWACVIIVGPLEFGTEMAAVLAKSRMANGCLVAVCHSDLILTDDKLFAVSECIDAVILGENLTQNSVPFGSLSLTSEVYSTWDNRRSLGAYSSTYAGNSVALSAVVSSLDDADLIDSAIAGVLQGIEASFDNRISAFRSTVHPAYIEYYLVEKRDLRIRSAEGNWIHLEDGRAIVDVSTLGCSLRGHNPDALSRELDNYDGNTDYLELIRKYVAKRTDFSEVFPAVSGAGAVDQAIALALAANLGRSKIISFSGNYSGKTLISVNFSKTAPLLADFNLDAFAPYYADVIYINPFADDAVSQFISACENDDIALIWFEMVQGYMVSRIPQQLLHAVQHMKMIRSYFVGVDEVLTGMWKSCRTMFFHQENIACVDLVTLSKATSDMVFPVSFCFATSTVVEAASKNCEKRVEAFRSSYHSNFGAFISCNAIQLCDDYFQSASGIGEVRKFHERLGGLLVESEAFSGIRAEGSLIKINISKIWFPFLEGSIEAHMIESAASKLIFKRAGVLLTNLRMFPPVIPDAQLHDEIICRLEGALCQITVTDIYNLAIEHSEGVLKSLGMLEVFKQIAVMCGSRVENGVVTSAVVEEA